jgi:hypothetical protein
MNTHVSSKNPCRVIDRYCSEYLIPDNDGGHLFFPLLVIYYIKLYEAWLDPRNRTANPGSR